MASTENSKLNQVEPIADDASTVDAQALTDEALDGTEGGMIFIRPNTCPYCDQVFFSYNEYNNHRKKCKK